jgi:putative nucleotidyltransferase with HDIG domain
MVGAFGSLTMVIFSSKVRSAQQVARSGLLVGLIQVVVILFLGVLLGWDRPILVISAVSGFFSGIIAAIFGLGVLPYMESFFSRISNLRLVELAAVNHPLLQKMSIEAPGTYHHSLIMASLAEAAAQSIGANGLLCRVGAYYHDIGKMVKPEYFVENQGALGNPHDPLPPNLSNLVIQSHVKEGVAMARQYNLDKAVIDFIVMHHGTSRIEYFYRRAIEQTPETEELNEDDYRYPGPKPYSKETAILMMADSVEATVRTLADPTHQRIQDQVQKIINGKISDGQMEEVPLTLSDIHKIEESFINTLTGIYHSRIKYPDPPSDAPEDRGGSPIRIVG